MKKAWKWPLLLVLLSVFTVYLTAQFIVSVPITVSSPSAFSAAKQNIPFNASLNVTGGSGPYTCAHISGSLPTGITRTNCTFSGTPTGTLSGTEVVSVTDSSGSVVPGNVSVTIAPASLSSIAVTPAPGGSLILATTATQQLVATGTWSDTTVNDLTTLAAWTSGTPAKATIGAATGIVTGVAAGTSLITATFSSVPGTNTVTVTANPAVSTTSLPNAQVNIPYAPQVLTASGGTPPFTWAVTVGSLPTGLTLTSSTGVISGTPTGTTQTFSVVGTDSLSATTAAKSLTLTVATVSSNAATLTPSTITVGSTSQGTSTTTYSDASTANTTVGSSLQRVEAVRASNATGTTISSLTTNSFNLRAGALLVVGVRHGTDFTSAITCTDLAGNTFTAIGSLTVNSPNLGSAQMLYAKNTVANAADTVTCTFAAPVAYDDVLVEEFTGADTSAPLDQHDETGTNGAATNSCISGAVTTSTANQVLVGYCTPASLNAVFSPGAGYSVDITDADGLGALEASIVSSVQTSVTANASFTGAAKQTIGLVASFKAASAMGATWSSASPLVASVNGVGVVTCTSAGTSVISAVVGGQTGNATITCQGGAVTSITVTPPSVSGAQGATQAFTATDQAGNNITGSVSWASSLPSCVSMNSATGTVASASACSSTITATLGSVGGSATFAGTGTTQTQGLLSGCTVDSSNVPSCATPAGWTLVSAVAFENGTPGNGSFVGTSITCTKGHTGNCSANHKVVKGDDTGEWDSPNIVGTKENWISWWEFDDAGGSMGTDLGMAGVRWPVVPGGNASYWIDPNSNSGCNPGQYPQNNIKLNRYMLIYGVGGLQTYGYTTGCLAPNAPSWGTWTQWEYHIKINDPTAFGNNSNGEYQLYQNGVLKVNMPAGTGACSTPDQHCSNMVGTENYNLYNHHVWIGGVSTYRAQYTSSAHTVCSTTGNDIGSNGEVTYGDFTSQTPCANQHPPNGWPMNTVSGGMNRYWDDIIVLKK